mmetsp:Transcript_12645/g.33622  ORF Transcript_12645/g.33622 Transcript_12645/m.33622 type:complete len:143 (+) Transcript_12645:115-543(+)
MRPKANPGAVGGGGGGRGRPRTTAWCASIQSIQSIRSISLVLLVVTTLVALNTVGVILRSAPERETTDRRTNGRRMMARFYRGDPVRDSEQLLYDALVRGSHLVSWYAQTHQCFVVVTAGLCACTSCLAHPFIIIAKSSNTG